MDLALLVAFGYRLQGFGQPGLWVDGVEFAGLDE